MDVNPASTAERLDGWVDGNLDGEFDLSDAIMVLLPLIAELAGTDEDALDSNDSGSLNTTDAVFILNALFRRGSAPTEPFICKSSSRLAWRAFARPRADGFHSESLSESPQELEQPRTLRLEPLGGQRSWIPTTSFSASVSSLRA